MLSRKHPKRNIARDATAESGFEAAEVAENSSIRVGTACSARASGGGRSQDLFHRNVLARQQPFVRVGRHALRLGRAQLGPSLAQRANSHAARPGALEVLAWVTTT